MRTTTICLLPLSLCITPLLAASQVTIHWQGTVTDISTFNSSNLPTGVAEGAVISGIFVFERNQYSKESNILSSHYYGTHYTYEGTVTHKFIVGDQEWSSSDAQVSLVGHNPIISESERNVALDVFSSSHRGHSYNQIPNYAGEFEMGFYFADHTSPYRLLSEVFDLESVIFDPEHITRARGFFTSRNFSPLGGVLDGYYVNFVIDMSSIEILGAIPEPASYALMLGAGTLAGVIGIRRRLGKVKA